jgi:hypothetical protein
MGILDRIEKSKMRDLLGKGWLTHDAMWFYHTCRELGVEKANALNKAAIRSLAPIEVARAKRVLAMDKQEMNTFDELREFLFEALELILPDSVFERFHLRSSSTDLLHWEWEKGECFAYKGMKRLGMIDGYRCGVMYRIECWLEALGVRYDINPKLGRCIMHQTGSCSGDIRVSFPGEGRASS